MYLASAGMDGRMDGRTDRHTDVQRETIITHHYRVEEYKNILFLKEIFLFLIYSFENLCISYVLSKRTCMLFTV